MATFWKVMLGLALVLPVTAYVAGTLVASSGESPRDLSPVVIEDSPSKAPTPIRRDREEPDDRDGTERVQVVTPPPARIDDDDREDDDDDDDEPDDDSDDGSSDDSDDD